MEIFFIWFKNYVNNLFMSTFYLNFYLIFFKNTYFLNFFKLIFKVTFNNKASFSNNLEQTSTYYILHKLKNFLIYKTHTYPCLNPSVQPCFNLYYYPVVIAHLKINKKYFQKICFFFCFINSHFWYAHFAKFNILLNFLILSTNFELNFFFNGFFLNIYHY